MPKLCYTTFMTTDRRKFRPASGSKLINLLDEKSLEAISRFGYVYKDPNNGKKRIRVFKNFNKTTCP